MRTLVLAALIATPALAGGAERTRLLGELDRLAQKSHWKGVERVYAQLEQQRGELPASAHVLAGQAAAQRGDATLASRRYLRAERTEIGSAGESLPVYRREYGQLHVRRVEATCIRLAPASRPFDPLKAAAVDVAAETLATTGTFQGLVPVGTYTVGTTQVEVQPGARPAVVQRTRGDSDCS